MSREEYIAWIETFSVERQELNGSRMHRVLAKLGEDPELVVCAFFEFALALQAWQRYVVSSYDCPVLCCLDPQLWLFDDLSMEYLERAQKLAHVHGVFNACVTSAQANLCTVHRCPDRQLRNTKPAEVEMKLAGARTSTVVGR